MKLPDVPEPPAGWCWTTLGDIAVEVRNGLSPKPNGDAGLPVLRISAVRPMRVDLNDKRYFDPPPVGWQSAQLHEGDLLFTRYSGTPAFVGVCGLVTGLAEPLVYPDKLIRVRVEQSVALPSFVEKAANSGISRAAIESNLKTTSGQVGLAGGDLKLTPLPLPPLNEQRRIVDKIEALTARSRRAKEALDAVPVLLDKLRQSILAAAFRGDLTKEWRAAHPDVEPASVLLDRIREERRARWEEAELAKMRAKGSLPKDDKWKSKYVEPEPVNTDDLPELPEGWAWARWNEVGMCQNGRAFPSDEYSEVGIKLLRPGNLCVDGSIEWSDKNTRCMPERWAEDFPDYVVGEGELVINLTAQSLKDEFLGRVCLTGRDERCLLNQRIGRLTPVELLPEWCLFWMKSPQFRTFVDGLNTGSLIQHMFTSQVDQHILPIPPAAEQIEMVRVLRSELSTVRKTGALSNLYDELARLDSAILAKAFRGELVPQDPNDEPASALLERIRAERESGVTTSPAKKTRAIRAAKTSKSASR